MFDYWRVRTLIRLFICRVPDNGKMWFGFCVSYINFWFMISYWFICRDLWFTCFWSKTCVSLGVYHLIYPWPIAYSNRRNMLELWQCSPCALMVQVIRTFPEWCSKHVQTANGLDTHTHTYIQKLCTYTYTNMYIQSDIYIYIYCIYTYLWWIAEPLEFDGL